jgi:hypothetical protein
MASLIYNIHNDLSISKLLHDKSLPIKLIEEKFAQDAKEKEKEEKGPALVKKRKTNRNNN